MFTELTCAGDHLARLQCVQRAEHPLAAAEPSCITSSRGPMLRSTGRGAVPLRQTPGGLRAIDPHFQMNTQLRFELRGRVQGALSCRALQRYPKIWLKVCLLFVILALFVTQQ